MSTWARDLQDLLDLEVVRECARAGALGLLCIQAVPVLAEQVAGLVRGFRFWQQALPIYVEYKAMQRALSPTGAGAMLSEEQRAKRWGELHDKSAPKILHMALVLRGFYVKLGQVASTRQDMFPRPWTDALRQLQGEHPELLARPLRDVQQVIRRELGPLASEVTDLRAIPIGAAATGQVHRATLKDGREVVVKVQYPDAQRLYREDFANTKLFCRLLQPEHLSYIQELEKQFYTEFDFRREALDLAEVSHNFAEASGNPYAQKVRVPEPVVELSARHIVVMEYLPGETLLSYGLRRKRELDQVSLFKRLWHGFFLLRELRSYLKLLIGVQGYQIFVDGVFNGDPHPGNILLMPDGRLGLIDYGNVKRLDLTERAKLGRLVVALADGDRAASVNVAMEMGLRTRHGDPEVIYRIARLAFDRDDPESMRLPDGTIPSNVQVYFEALAARDPMAAMPATWVMAARSSFLLRGMGTHFGLKVHVAREWRQLARRAVLCAEAGAARDPKRLRAR